MNDEFTLKDYEEEKIKKIEFLNKLANLYKEYNLVFSFIRLENIGYGFKHEGFNLFFAPGDAIENAFEDVKKDFLEDVEKDIKNLFEATKNAFLEIVQQ